MTKAATVEKTFKMLRLDGEIWEVRQATDHDLDNEPEAVVRARKARPKKSHPEILHDQKAIDAGMDLVQTSYGGDFYREVRQIS